MISMDSWVNDAPGKISNFISEIEKPTRPGAFTYTMTGDCYDIEKYDHLGSIVYALKTLYTIRKEDSQISRNAFNRLKKFQSSSGFFEDPLVAMNSPKGWKSKIFKRKYNQIFNQYLLAETRQSYSASLLVNSKLDLYKFDHIPKDSKSLISFLENLDWRNPWHSGAQFSHLMFFYHLLEKNSNEVCDFEVLKRRATEWITRVYRATDGLWYSRNPNIKTKINGAMKILTGLEYHKEALEKVDFAKLASSCLDNYGQNHACDLLNHMLVLNTCYRYIDSTDLRSRIEEAAAKWIVDAEEYYCEDKGGFFFNKDQPNLVYYGSQIARNDFLPDIHATVLFSWGLALAMGVLDPKNRLYRVFKT